MARSGYLPDRVVVVAFESGGATSIRGCCAARCRYTRRRTPRSRGRPRPGWPMAGSRSARPSRRRKALRHGVVPALALAPADEMTWQSPARAANPAEVGSPGRNGRPPRGADHGQRPHRPAHRPRARYAGDRPGRTRRRGGAYPAHRPRRPPLATDGGHPEHVRPSDHPRPGRTHRTASESTPPARSSCGQTARW